MLKDKSVAKCKICGKEFKLITWKHLHFTHKMKIEDYDEKYGKEPHGVATSTPEIVKKANATKIKNGTNVAWNRGLTKETNDSLKKMSEARMGKNNPWWSIEEPRKIKLNKELGARGSKYGRARTGLSNKELFGETRAAEIKKASSAAHKKRTIHGHAGRKHTEETKNIIRQKTIQYITECKNKVSAPQRKLYNYIVLNLKENSWELEKNIGFYSIDIAEPNLKFAIEVDGDFYHVNEERGFTLKYDVQKRTKRNEKTKNSYLLNRNWNLMRIWASDIEENFEKVIKQIDKFIKELNDKTSVG